MVVSTEYHGRVSTEYLRWMSTECYVDEHGVS